MRESLSESDAQLMDRLVKGDLEALGFLFKRHQKNVFELCVRMTRDQTAADDLVQETFLRVLKYRHNFRGEARFSTWLFQVARNVTLDHLKRERSRSRRSDTHREPGASPLDAEQIASEDSSPQDDRVVVLDRALSLLPDDKKEVLILSRYHELQYSEIARICECSVSAVKVRVFRAMNQLREKYFELENE